MYIEPLQGTSYATEEIKEPTGPLVQYPTLSIYFINTLPSLRDCVMGFFGGMLEISLITLPSIAYFAAKSSQQ